MGPPSFLCHGATQVLPPDFIDLLSKDFRLIAGFYGASGFKTERNRDGRDSSTATDAATQPLKKIVASCPNVPRSTS